MCEDRESRSDSEETDERNRSRVTVQALKLGFQLALNERDAIIRQYEQLASAWELSKKINWTQMHPEETPTPTGSPGARHLHNALLPSQIDSITMSSPKLNNRSVTCSYLRSVALFV